MSCIFAQESMEIRVDQFWEVFQHLDYKYRKVPESAMKRSVQK